MNEEVPVDQRRRNILGERKVTQLKHHVGFVLKKKIFLITISTPPFHRLWEAYHQLTQKLQQ